MYVAESSRNIDLKKDLVCSVNYCLIKQQQQQTTWFVSPPCCADSIPNRGTYRTIIFMYRSTTSSLHGLYLHQALKEVKTINKYIKKICSRMVTCVLTTGVWEEEATAVVVWSTHELNCDPMALRLYDRVSPFSPSTKLHCRERNENDTQFPFTWQQSVH